MSSHKSAKMMILMALCALGSAISPTGEARAEDSRAIEVAHRLMDAMGGKEAWDAQRTLVFRFAVVRDDEELSNWHHTWDRYTGQYRLEGQTRDGELLQVLFNVNSKEGEAWLDASPVPPEELEKYLEYGYGRFINDTYWLLMPWKWLDPGVHLAYEGEETLDGVVHDVVRLSFEGEVGLTSGDQYWGYVSRDTGLMTRWGYLLQDEEGNPGTGDRTVYRWEDWRAVNDDGIRLSTSKVRAAEGPEIAITHPLITASREAEPEAFQPVSPPSESTPR